MPYIHCPGCRLTVYGGIAYRDEKQCPRCGTRHVRAAGPAVPLAAARPAACRAQPRRRAGPSAASRRAASVPPPDRSLKRRLSKLASTKLVNPVVRRLLDHGLMPRTHALLETTGRKSGQPRRVPVGNGLRGDTFWIVTEHGRAVGLRQEHRGGPARAREGRPRVARRHGAPAARRRRPRAHEGAAPARRTTRWCGWRDRT